MRLTVPAISAVLVLSIIGTAQQPKPPSAHLGNGVLNASIYLPNSETGYYRGARFDWSGVVSQVEFKGHSFFGVWFPHYDPHLHDAITGPVEEFRTGSTNLGSALGYDQAPPGGLFVKVGVGVLKRVDAKPYSFVQSYPIVNTGSWTCRRTPNSVQFEQVLKVDSGYAYQYTKTIGLVPHKAEMVLEHRLKNIGERVIDTDVYDHDFYVLDAQPTGPGARVIFQFHPESANEPTWSNASDLAGKAHIESKELVFDRELQTHEQAASLLKGYSDSVTDNDIRVQNTKARIGVEEIGDHPLVRLNLWSIRTTICPEAFIHLHIEPGKEAGWKIRYVFYELQ